MKKKADKMKWRKLMDMQCPKCEKAITQKEHGGYECTKVGCDFKIGKEKFDSVLTSIYKNVRI